MSVSSHSPQIGLVLSGGAARGIAHIGVLQALKELQIPIHAVAGTSMGAIVGAFFAAGIPPLGMLEILRNDRRLVERFDFRFFRGGLLNMSFLHDMLDEYIGLPTFEQLALPLYVAATNLNTGETRYFHQGPLYPAVSASAAIPVIFAPQVIDEQTYVDGGLTNNLPTDPLRAGCDFLIGVHVNYQEDLHEIDGLGDIASRCFSMAIYQTVRDRRLACDLLIEPPATRQFALFDFDEVDALYQTGYEAVQSLRSQANGPLQSLLTQL
jgi:NTE family protein